MSIASNITAFVATLITRMNERNVPGPSDYQLWLAAGNSGTITDYRVAMSTAAQNMTTAQRTALTGTNLWVGRLITDTDNNWTWRYHNSKWNPWWSPWVPYTASYANWAFGSGSNQSCRYRWEEGYMHLETYTQAFNTTNTDQLVISVPEPIRFDYNIVKSPTILDSSVHVYDNGSGIDFWGKVRPNREYAALGGQVANPMSMIPKVSNLSGNGYIKLLGIGSGTPFTAANIPNGSQVWADVRYESANYPFL